MYDPPGIPAVTDGDPTTCEVVNTESYTTVVKTGLYVSFRDLKVVVLGKGEHITFAPMVDMFAQDNSTLCATNPHLLTTHASPDFLDMKRCDPFCEVPKACWVMEKKKRSSNFVEYHFLVNVNKILATNSFFSFDQLHCTEKSISVKSMLLSLEELKISCIAFPLKHGSFFQLLTTNSGQLSCEG